MKNDIKGYNELIEYVNPKDILYILGFSGHNDIKGNSHYELRKKYDRLFFSNTNDETKLGFIEIKNMGEFYETLIKCIQDFYWWSHQFDHSDAHYYKRVIKALEIPKELYDHF